ncbi:MAG TPA: hypothetical protein QGF58_14530 [Myxococcota bacterium]|nr:hypothetical protein [Myxococcota bacterium]
MTNDLPAYEPYDLRTRELRDHLEHERLMLLFGPRRFGKSLMLDRLAEGTGMKKVRVEGRHGGVPPLPDEPVTILVDDMDYLVAGSGGAALDSLISQVFTNPKHRLVATSGTPRRELARDLDSSCASCSALLMNHSRFLVPWSVGWERHIDEAFPADWGGAVARVTGGYPELVNICRSVVWTADREGFQDEGERDAAVLAMLQKRSPAITSMDRLLRRLDEHHPAAWAALQRTVEGSKRSPHEEYVSAWVAHGLAIDGGLGDAVIAPGAYLRWRIPHYEPLEREITDNAPFSLVPEGPSSGKAVISGPGGDTRTVKLRKKKWQLVQVLHEHRSFMSGAQLRDILDLDTDAGLRSLVARTRKTFSDQRVEGVILNRYGGGFGLGEPRLRPKG